MFTKFAGERDLGRTGLAFRMILTSPQNGLSSKGQCKFPVRKLHQTNRTAVSSAEEDLGAAEDSKLNSSHGRGITTTFKCA